MSVEDGRGYRHYTLIIMEIDLIALTTTASLSGPLGPGSKTEEELKNRG